MDRLWLGMGSRVDYCDQMLKVGFLTGKATAGAMCMISWRAAILLPGGIQNLRWR